MRFVPLGQEDEPSYTFVPLAEEAPAPVAEKPSSLSNLGGLINKATDWALGTKQDGERGGSVMQDAVLPDPQLDPELNRQTMLRSKSPESVMFTAGKGKQQADQMVARGAKLEKTAKQEGFSSVPSMLAEPERSQKQRNFAEDLPGFVRGMVKGAGQTVGLAQGAAGLVGDLTGNEELKDWGIDSYRDSMRKAGDFGVAKDFTDIASPSDALGWVAENSGYVAFQAAQSILSAGLGGAIANTVGKKALGETIGLVLSNAPQAFGSVYGEASDESLKTGKPVDMQKVLIGATVSMAIDTLADKIGLDALTAKGFKGNALARIGKSTALQVGVQGGTEMAQLVPEEWGAGRDPFRDGMLKQYINEGAVGGLGGAGPGLAGAIKRAPASAKEEAEMALANELNGGQFAQSQIDALVSDTIRTEAPDSGLVRPTATVRNFSAPDSPATLAGVTPVVVPIVSNPNAAVPNVSTPLASGELAAGATAGGGNLAGAGVRDAGLVAADPTGGVDGLAGGTVAGGSVAPTVSQQNQTSPVARTADADLLARVPVAREPDAVLAGPQGTGYSTKAMAESAGMMDAKKQQPELDWVVEPLDAGGFRVAGYAKGSTNEAPTSLSNAPVSSPKGEGGLGNAGQAVTGGTAGVANQAGRAVSPTLVRDVRDAAAARASAQVRLDQLHQADPKTYPKVTLGAPAPEAEAQVSEAAVQIANVFGVKEQVIVFADESPESANGFELNGTVYINTRGITNNALRTGWHETHHVLQGIAEASDRAGLKNTPAQKYRDSVDGLFDQMTDAGKRAYIENFLYAGELEGLTGSARETAIQERLVAPLLRREMMADFVGNRGTDRKFASMLVEADPVGFKAFAEKWLDIIDNLINTLRGRGSSSSLAVDKSFDETLTNLNKARLVLRDALVELRKSNPQAAADSTKTSLSAKQVDAATDEKKLQRGVIGEVAPDPRKPVAAEWDAMTTPEKEQATRAVAKKLMTRVFDQLGLRGWDVSFSSGSWLGKVNPNFIVTAPDSATAAQLDEVARVVGYVLDQQGMVTFDENNTTGENQAGFVEVRLPSGMTDAKIKELRKHIGAKAARAGSDTMRNGSLFFGNFTGYDEDGGLSDADYQQAIFDAVDSFDPSAGVIDVVGVTRFESALIEPDSRNKYRKGTRYDSQIGTENTGDINVRGQQGRAVSQLRNLGREFGALRQQWIDASESGRERGAERRKLAAEESARADSKRSAVEYGTASPDSTVALGQHFSQQKRSNLSSDYYGRGLKGAEADRLKGNADITPRIYFYVDSGKGVTPEAGVGGIKHTVRLNNLYNISKDPLGLVKTSKGTTAAERMNGWERLIMQSGFDGYLADTGANQNFAVLVGKHNIAMSRKQDIDSINDLGNFNLDGNDDIELDFTGKSAYEVDTKEDMQAFMQAEKQAQLQAELDAEQATFRAKMVARAAAAKVKSPRDVTVEQMQEKGLFPEQAMPFGEVDDSSGDYMQMSLPVGYPERGMHDMQMNGYGWTASAPNVFVRSDNRTPGFSQDGAIKFVKNQLARDLVANAGFDLNSAYRKGTVLKLAQVWRNLAGKTGMFKLPDSGQSKGFVDIAKEMKAFDGFEVAESVYPISQLRIDFTFKRKSDGEVFTAYISGNAGSKYFDCCTLGLAGSGNLGTTFYAVTSEWARLNDKGFMADQMLSGINTARRTEQAVSYGLKTGNTTVILPGKQNRVYGFNAKAATKEDHDMNLSRLLLAGMRNAMEVDPDIRRLRYNPETDAFTTADGKDASDKVSAFLSNPDARAYGMGRTTLARAVITSEIITGSFDASKVTAFKTPIAYSKKQGLDSPLSESWGEPGDLTPQIKEFLGDSKIVRADGTPIVMFHGTAQDISEFKPKQAGAIFLTESPVFADEFAGFSAEWMARNYTKVLEPEQVEQAKANAIKAIMADKFTKMPERQRMVEEIRSGKATGAAQDALIEAAGALMPSGPNIVPLVVRAENPFDYKNESHRAALIDAVYENASAGRGGEIKYWGDGSEAIVLEARKGGMSITRAMMDESLKDGDWSLVEEPEIQQAIRDAGHDSFWVQENGQRNLAVYEPTQIKSVFNNGNYDQSNPGISFSPKQLPIDPKLERWAQTIFNGRGDVTESKILMNSIPHEAMTMGPGVAIGRDQLVVLDGHALDHAAKHLKDGITAEMIGQLPAALKAPRAVVFQAPGQLMAMLPLRAKDGSPVVVILKKGEVSGGGQSMKITRFATTYPLTNSATFLVSEIRKGNRVWLPLEEVSRLRDLLGRLNATQGENQGQVSDSRLTQTLVPSLSRGRNQAVKTFNVLSDDALVKKKSGDKDWVKATEGVEIPDDAEKQLKGVAFSRKQPIVRAPGMADESKFMAVRRTLQDQFIQVRELQDMLTSRGGVVGEQQDVYRAEERMHGRAQELLTDFARNQVEPLMKKITSGKIELNELSLYAYAQHAKERNAYIKSINPKIGDAGSGMSDMEADNIIQMVQLSGDQAKFDELHQDLLGITSTTRRVLLDEGLITQDEYNGWDGLYDNYVPLRGFENVTPEGNPRPGVSRGFSTTGKESIKALGRKSKAGDILENIIRDYERAVIRSEKNAVAKTFLDLATSNPDPDLWEIQPVKLNRSFNKASGMVLMSNANDTGEDTIAVKVAGQQVRIKIKDPLVLRAMKLAAKDETSQLERLLATTLGTYTNLMRNTLTRFNPIFGAINAVRDVQMGAVSVFDELGAEGLKLYTKYYTPSLAASFRKERNTSNLANPMDRWLQEMRFAGGTTGGFQLRDVSDITDSMRTMMLQAGAAPSGKWESVRASRGYKGAQALGSWLEIIGSTSEDAARVAAYRAAREMGKTPAEAASISKNLTTNFNRKGEWGTTLNSLYLFFNAAVQGSTRVLQALKNPKVQAMMAGVTATSMAIALANAGAGDDDDGQAYWDKIPAFEKERNFIFMLPEGIEMDGAEQVGTRGRFIKIPMPYGLNVFPVLGNQLADLVRYSQDPNRGVKPAKAAINMVSAVFGSFNPFGGGLDISKPVEVGMAMAPTAADLAIQLMTGSNAFGRPVGPEQSPFDDKPDSENFSAKQAGTMAQYAARWINSVTGGNEARSGMIDVMPGTLDNVVRNTTGGLGVFIADTFVNLPTKLLSPVEATNRDIPLIRNFYGQIDEVTDIGLFYDRRAEVTKEMDRAKAEMKLGIEVDYSDEQLTDMALGKAAQAYTKYFSDLRKQEIAIAADDELSRGEKMLQRKELESLRAGLARSFNADYLEAKKQ